MKCFVLSICSVPETGSKGECLFQTLNCTSACMKILFKGKGVKSINLVILLNCWLTHVIEYCIGYGFGFDDRTH